MSGSSEGLVLCIGVSALDKTTIDLISSRHDAADEIIFNFVNTENLLELKKLDQVDTGCCTLIVVSLWFFHRLDEYNKSAETIPKT